MSGHSKWSQIKHKKAAADVEKGKIFSKITRMITVAAREKGGDMAMNPKLKSAVEKAKEVNMPSENVERAIKKGLGTLEGASLEEVLYESYGPGGVAIIVEAITDNKNRTTNEIKHLLSQHEAKFAESGSVLWAFEKTADGWKGKHLIEISDEDTKKKLEKLFDVLDNNDDVQEIYSNADFGEN